MTTTIEVTFTDPCDPPVSITAPVFENKMYTLTDPNAPSYDLSLLQFIVNPAFCKYNYIWTISELISVTLVSAITETNNVFEFFYNYELELTQTQTVTLTLQFCAW